MSPSKRAAKTEARRRNTQGCLTDCVAYLLNVHPAGVPLFVFPRKGWAIRFRAYWKRRGYDVRWVLANRPPGRGTHIVCGDSLSYRNSCHVVVYRNGHLIFDPDYPSRWKDARITHRLLIRRIDNGTTPLHLHHR
jgi:hypothetical protein